jgi:hypothetical protein
MMAAEKSFGNSAARAAARRLKRRLAATESFAHAMLCDRNSPRVKTAKQRGRSARRFAQKRGMAVRRI